MSAAAVLPKLAALYASEPQTVPLYARLSIHIGQEAELFMTDGTFSASVHGPAGGAGQNSARYQSIRAEGDRPNRRHAVLY